MELVEKLKEYFATTTKEQQDADWEAVKHLNNIGPTVDEYFEAYETCKNNTK